MQHDIDTLSDAVKQHKEEKAVMQKRMDDMEKAKNKKIAELEAEIDKAAKDNFAWKNTVHETKAENEKQKAVIHKQKAETQELQDQLKAKGGENESNKAWRALWERYFREERDEKDQLKRQLETERGENRESNKASGKLRQIEKIMKGP